MEDKIETGEFTLGDQYKALTEEKVSELAKDIWSGQTFVSWSLKEHDMHLLTSIFMPIMFIDEITRKTWLRDKITHFYAPMSEAGPRSINGYPMFMSLGILNKDDAKRVHDKIVAIQKAMAAI